MQRKFWMRVTVASLMALVVVMGAAYLLAQEGGAKPAQAPPGGPTLWTLFMATMPVGALLLGLSIAGVAFSIQEAGHIKEEKICPQALVMQLDDLLTPPDPQSEQQLEFDEEGNLVNLQQAVNVCDQMGDCYLARIVAGGLMRLDRGVEEAVHGAEETASAESFNLNARISKLSLIGNLGPLVGLLGTVTGMISSFTSIEKIASPSPKDLAKGVYESLVNTTMGLFIAIAFLTVYFFYKNNLAKRLLKANATALELMGKAGTLMQMVQQQQGGART